MKKLFSLVLVFCMAMGPLAHADDVWTMAESDQYGRKAGGMLGRGVVNVATSFMDVIVHTVEGTKDGPPLFGTLAGLGTGIGCTALRLTSGALDVLTFWVPGFNGFVVCKSYKDCINCEPEIAPVMPVPAVAAPAAVTPYAEPVPAKRPESPMKYVKK